MNESDLENELRALRPAAPSPGLESRIAAELRASTGFAADSRAARVPLAQVLAPAPSEPKVVPFWRSGFAWTALAAAAVAVLMVWRYSSEPTVTPAPEVAVAPPAETEADADYLEPETENELLAADEYGIFYTDGSAPVRQMRFRSVERYAWTHPETGARVEVEVPREDIVLMPVAMQ